MQDALKTPQALTNLSSKDRQELLDLLSEFITQSYKIEEEFKVYRALYEHVIEIIPQAIWVFNSNGSIFYRNSQAKSLSPILTSTPLLEECHSQYLNKNSTVDSTYEVDFEGKTYLLQSNCLEDKFIITATDITQQKRQERLAAMGQISAHLAHEIRNPIGSILLLSGLLLKKVPMNATPIILEIQKCLWRVERHIKATLLFSRGVSLSRANHKLLLLQEELKEILYQYTYTKNINVEYDFCDEEFNFDFDLISIVLQNFLYNAIDAIEEGEREEGEIKIRATCQDKSLCFYIQDNGKPIENKHLLFEPFETTKLKGNGLGLALSLQIIEAHNGSISLFDEEKKIFKILITNPF